MQCCVWLCVIELDTNLACWSVSTMLTESTGLLSAALRFLLEVSAKQRQTGDEHKFVLGLVR